MRELAFAAGALAFACCAQAMEPPAFGAEKARIDQLWSVTPLATEMTVVFGSAARRWSYRVNTGLPFPDHWPPERELALVYYIHAVALAPQLRDAEIRAEPWARIVATKQQTTIEALDVQYRELGAQGVRPLRKDEVEIRNYGSQAQEFLGSLTALPSDADILVAKTRAYYCLALRNNSDLRPAYASRHATFIAWLNCENK